MILRTQRLRLGSESPTRLNTQTDFESKNIHRLRRFHRFETENRLPSLSENLCHLRNLRMIALISATQPSAELSEFASD